MARLVILLLWGVLVYLVWRLLFPPRPRPPEPGREGVIDTMVRDPQCDTYVPRSTALRRRVRGRVHYFCSRECLRAFRRRSP